MATTAFLYEDEADWKLHYRAIQLLARDSGMSEGEIRVLYEVILISLKKDARIKDYLAVLVSRNVKEQITRT